MAGITKTITIVAGEDVTITFTAIKNAAGSTIDFTGASSATYKVSSTAGGGTSVLSKTIGSGISTPGTSFTVTLSDSDTDITPGSYYHECKITVGSVTYQVLDPSPFIVKGSSI